MFWYGILKAMAQYTEYSMPYCMVQLLSPQAMESSSRHRLRFTHTLCLTQCVYTVQCVQTVYILYTQCVSHIVYNIFAVNVTMTTVNPLRICRESGCISLYIPDDQGIS